MVQRVEAGDGFNAQTKMGKTIKKKAMWMGWRGRNPRHGGGQIVARCGEKKQVVDKSKIRFE